MYLQGLLQVDIAKKLSVSQPTVSNDLKFLHKEWQEDAQRDIDEVKAKELAKIDRLEREHWKAWKRSCEGIEKTTTREKVTADGTVITTVTSTIGQTGDPKFLSGVMSCIEQRLKIFGIYEATKIKLEDWQDEIVSLLASGDIDPADVKAIYPDKADDFFAKATIQQ